eukprot:UN28501
MFEHFDEDVLELSHLLDVDLTDCEPYERNNEKKISEIAKKGLRKLHSREYEILKLMAEYELIDERRIAKNFDIKISRNMDKSELKDTVDVQI